MRTPLDTRPCRSIAEACFDRAKQRADFMNFSSCDGDPHFRLELERQESGRDNALTPPAQWCECGGS